jgi:hypothetical protein
MNNRITFHRTCLNCLFGIEHVMHPFIDGFVAHCNSITNEFGAEHAAKILIRRELYEKRITCEMCNYMGAFDIDNLEIDSESIYKNPKTARAVYKFKYSKINNESKFEFFPIKTDDVYVSHRTLMDVAKNSVKGMPKTQFIEHPNGTVDLIVALDKNHDGAVNKLNHIGYSREDILTKIEWVESEARKLNKY